jgi:ribosomal protein S18 acetylase RimI-like enzyme
MTVEIRFLGPNDAPVLDRCADDVFDEPISPELTSEFLNDARHHVVVGIEDGVIVGMATGVHYVHPDKPAQLFINEVGVASSHRERGIGRRLIEALVRRAEELGCTEAWVLTDRDNAAARRLYESAGAEAPPDDCVMYTFRLRGD